MKKEKPVRVVPTKWSRGHKTETRIREIHESFCVQSGCKFKGKRSQQGVCHTTDSIAGKKAPLVYVDQVMKYAEEGLKEFRRLNRGKGPGATGTYVRYLESMYVCHVATNSFMLDELVKLRAQVASRRPPKR